MTRRRGSSPAVILVAVAMVLLAGCDWTTFRGGPAHTGSVGEVTLDVDNVGDLEPQWSSSPGVNAFDEGTTGQPAVVGGLMYTTFLGRVNAYDAAGVDGCDEANRICTPLWVGIADRMGHVLSPPTVSDGLVYASRTDGVLFAFDAEGVTNCEGGSPTICDPLWSSGANTSYKTPTVAGGIVYTTSANLLTGDVLMAFDAAGIEGCSGTPKVCTPLWRANIGFVSGLSVPTVAEGRVFVSGGDGIIRALDAAGVVGCTAAHVCHPIATLATGIPSGRHLTLPAVTGGRLYVSSETGLLAFDSDGDEGCTGSPPTCAPLWTAAAPVAEGFPVRPPAIAAGIVYANRVRLEGTFVHDIVAIDANGEIGCTGPPAVCEPLWSTDPLASDSGLSGPTVANGVMYATGANRVSCTEFDFCDTEQHVYAWDANAVEGCSGTPAQCGPLLDRTVDHQGFFNDARAYEPVVSNGVLYITETQLGPDITAFGLPSR